MIGFCIASALAIPASFAAGYAAANRDWGGVKFFGTFALIFGIIAVLQWNGY